MSANAFVDNAKVMAKGQITIPKDVRDVLGVSNGDRVTFIAQRTGLTSEDDVMALVKELRSEDEKA